MDIIWILIWIIWMEIAICYSYISNTERSKSIYTSVILTIPVSYLHEGIDNSLIPNENIDIYLITTRKYRYVFDISRLIITIYVHVYIHSYMYKSVAHTRIVNM